MAHVTLIVVLAFACVGLAASSTVNDDLLKTLTSRLLRVLADESLMEKRGFYNVVRNKDQVKVYFQSNTRCKECAHTVLYGNNKLGSKKMQTKQGEKSAVIGPFPFDQELTIMVCEDIKSVKDNNCRYARLPAGKVGHPPHSTKTTRVQEILDLPLHSNYHRRFIALQKQGLRPLSQCNRTVKTGLKTTQPVRNGASHSPNCRQKAARE